ncbi:HEAT repeat domain-containing protein [Bdellovibrio bacteriovorus]|uniref:HEAT repeat domain-containing protein n=1 Tax=Bdellovibrio bacteriovorus TaxID=959 RepID=UPI0035A8B9B5
MSTTTLSTLIEMLDTQSDKAAEKIITKLVGVGKGAIPRLMEAAKNDQKPRIQKWALQALGAIGDKRAAPLLLNALDDERMTVRLHALRGLGKMKYKKGTKKISVLLLNDESGGIRVNALYALMAIKDPSILPQIQKSLSDPQWYVRQNACVACGILNATKAKPKLKKMSNSDERKAVRNAALEALSKIG